MAEISEVDRRIVYICSLCNTRSTTLPLWMSHLRLVHQADKFTIQCPVDGCNVSYSKVNSLCSHIYRKHQGICATLPALPVTAYNDTSEVSQSGILVDTSLPSSLNHDIDQLLHRDVHEQQKKSSLFLLQLKEERLLTQAAINDVVTGCREVFQHTVCHLRAGISHRLSQSGIDASDINGFDEVFSEVSDPFVGLETSYLQDKFVTQELKCIEPLEVQVGSSQYVTRQSGAKRRKTLNRDKFYYVPILETLRQLLQIDSVRREVFRPVQSQSADTKLLYDLSDGSLFKEHGFFKANPRGLQIIAYYDEVETCNPLGSSSGKFKLGCVFFTLGNIRPMFRSRLNAIFLVAVAKSSTIKTNGIDSILNPFISDLKELHDTGISLQFAGNSEVWRGVLLAFLADNLAAHELGGFKESFSFARKFCRSCLTDKDQSQIHFREDQFVLRDRKSHENLCSRLRDSDGASVSVEYGINRQSSLDSLPHFSVAENMPHDIMHDLFEGAVPYELKLFLHYSISQSYFSIEALNHCLSAFDFGCSEVGDRPASIGEDLKLRQTASQMWLLARILPLLIGDRIPRDNRHWNCFLKLLKICEICTAPMISANTAAYLELLVEEHHSEFKLLYPGESITPKLHFLIHFAHQIIKFGPLVHTWTMRHEAKLRIMKRAARVSNFKNVCQTVAKRHQHLLCYYIHSKRLLEEPIKTGRCKQELVTIHPEAVQLLLAQKFKLTEQSILYSLSFVNYHGITYKPNAFILLSYDDLEPKFGKIIAVNKLQSYEIILVLREFMTMYYDNHYHAFCISENHDIFHLTCVHDLAFYDIFHPRRTFAKDGRLYINLKHHFEC